MDNKDKILRSLVQFFKYSLIGGLNVTIDVVMLNILSYATGITRGKMLFVFNIIAFCVYSICGYILNKKFTFKKTSEESAYFGYASVLFVSMILNSFMLVLLTSHNPLIHLMHHQRNIMKLNHLWLNISMLIGSIIIGIGAFLINKFYIFNKKKTC